MSGTFFVEVRAYLSPWHTASNGGPQRALIPGEVGIGKTRLAEELTTWANRQGIPTALAHCYAAEGGAGVYARHRLAARSTVAPVGTCLANRSGATLTGANDALSQSGASRRVYRGLATATIA